MFHLQLTLFLLLVFGYVCARVGIITKEGRKVLTALVIDLFLPCSFIRSFCVTFDESILQKMGLILFIGFAYQFASLFLSRFLFPGAEKGQQVCMKYGIICSNAGFMGQPMAEGVLGSEGLLYASVALIPIRLFMWSAGLALFTATDRKSVVKKLLTLNQIESGGEQISMEHFDLIEMIEGVLNSYRIMVEQKQAKVELKSPEQVYIWADEYMAEEVIRNYIGNALNHIEGEKRIWISVKKENSKAHLEVRNTGTPIPEEDLGRIWDKFYKVDKARTREYGGSGIGLSIVRAVMEAHNCAYGVRNETDGVTFFCEFDCK